jgi:HTH-type transcriptional regulator, sugar sensing transcriptional regulator
MDARKQMHYSKTMKKSRELLQRLGLSKKEVAIYHTLLSLGPSSVRHIAEKTGVNRGTTHEALKTLQEKGLVSYYHKEKRQYFVAEDPVALTTLLKRKKASLEEIEENLQNVIPQLRSLYSEVEERPVVKYYENPEGIRTILQDVLDTTERLEEKEYAVYSSSKIKQHLHNAFQNYSEERIKRNIAVRAISIGPGGEEVGLDERRWLTREEGAPTYTLIYGGKAAIISVNKNETPHGVIIEDHHIYQTQLLIFNSIWEKLK